MSAPNCKRFSCALGLALLMTGLLIAAPQAQDRLAPRAAASAGKAADTGAAEAAKIDRRVAALERHVRALEARGALPREPGQIGKHAGGRFDAGGRIQIYIEWQDDFAAIEDALARHDAVVEIVDRKLRKAQTWLPYGALDAAAALPAVKRITLPHYAITKAGGTTTAGDTILKADLLRAAGVSGQGVKVGILSDGANDIAAPQASGDLPADLTRFGTCVTRPFDGPNCDPGWNCNEGTAMAEIVHDIAPSADIAVAAVNTDLEFIARLGDLVNTFHADVVVDDLFFPAEPYFADGAVAQAVNDIADQVVYVSAAGNSAIGHYDALALTSNYLGLDAHNFGARAGMADDFTLNVAVQPGQLLGMVLQWNDPFGASANDYDMYLVNEAETDLACDLAVSSLCVSIEIQSGASDPLEGVCYYNDSGTPKVVKLIIDRFDAQQRQFEMVAFGGSQEYNVPSGSVLGQAALTDVLAVGAIDAADPGNDVAEPYSSQGPSVIQLPSLESRPKPDVMAIDGVSVTGSGGFPSPFFGTSAAAPHVAGVAALLIELAPAASPAEIRNAIKQGAVDLGAAGVDSIYGHGRVDAVAAANILDPDSDGDGLRDSQDNCPNAANAGQTDTDTDGIGNACDPDDDGDGMPDSFENAYGLDPLDPSDASADADGDGLGNLEEFQQATDPQDPADPPDLDPDGDGLTNAEEVALGTDLLNPDTDGDGVGDGEEVSRGTNPTVNEPAVIGTILQILLGKK